ncbi:glycosyltransferase family 2 protein [Flavobacterium sp. ACAM 123]|uniref:glycosyltransferase family 2 protein n=1 Tax=Flavobacterium sp. ACAM 123 TaxID=1189620 RepID=UPI000361FE32|nr:glycosyltransferase family 2 protein [Flavobacterium sp. ACAM 123]
MENNVLVSIIVPCYNQAQFLDEALQSVLDQTYTDWECIIVNDGSPDHTEEVAKKWAAKDNRFNYYYKENGGLSSARNLGLEKAKGDFIQFLDSDDCIDKTKLELSLEQFNATENSGVTIVISNFRMFVENHQNTTVPYCTIYEQLFNFESVLYQWEEVFTIPIHCGLFEVSFFKGFKFPEHIKAKEDWVMWVSLFKTNCTVIFIDKPLAFYRRNPASMQSTRDMLPDFIEACDYFKNLLTYDEYRKFSLLLISRYYKSNREYKNKWTDLKNSNTFQTGLMIKKTLKTMGILKLSKSLFPLFLKLKTK